MTSELCPVSNTHIDYCATASTPFVQNTLQFEHSGKAQKIVEAVNSFISHTCLCVHFLGRKHSKRISEADLNMLCFSRYLLYFSQK
jgi:hypothetical protein